MTRVAWVGLAALAAAGGGSPAAAQAPRTCVVVVDSTGGVGTRVDIGGGRIRFFQNGGAWAHCRGQATSWYSDSVAWYQDFDRFDMIGRVRFRDSTAELTADRASYYLGQERLDAQGNARLTNRATGSVLRGPQLSYLRRVTGLRDTASLTATGRPTVEYRDAADTAGAEPYLIIADRVLMRGNSAASAWGTVTIDRSDFHARADSALLDTGEGVGRLMSRASVAGQDDAGYHLTGRDIRFRLTARTLTWAQAEGDAQATNVGWRLVADTVQFDILNDRIQRGAAWGDSLRPNATSATLVFTADSLGIDAPDQVLDEVRGYGTAKAASRRDSLDLTPDWIEGDTVTARFGPTALGTRTVSQILALGKAAAWYRVYPAQRPAGAEPDISYNRGDRILAVFANERLSRVDVVGHADGVYLESKKSP